jgi:hypothetical protein
LGAVALGSESIRTISECPDTAISRFAEDQAAGKASRGYWGYVPEIEKVMIRDIRLDEATNDRFEEQIALPGTYLSHEFIRIALQEAGLNAGDMDKTELHGAQMLARDSLLEFVERLDKVATQQWCVNIFMGEMVEWDHPKDYGRFKQEALERQKSLRDLAETTAEFILDLAEEKFDPTKAPAHVEEFVKALLLGMGKNDPSVIRHMFDEKTAAGVEEILRLESIGQYEEANALFAAVLQEAPGGGYCGAGSCGLENINLGGDDNKELRDRLRIRPGDTVLKDKERPCKDCGKKTLVYAFSKSKVNTACSNPDCKAVKYAKGTVAA